MLNKYKNVAYKLTTLGILFPAPIKKRYKTNITCTELNDIKKALINRKICGLLEIIDLKKMNN